MSVKQWFFQFTRKSKRIAIKIVWAFEPNYQWKWSKKVGVVEKLLWRNSKSDEWADRRGCRTSKVATIKDRITKLKMGYYWWQSQALFEYMGKCAKDAED